jgi:hypothetical protein
LWNRYPFNNGDLKIREQKQHPESNPIVREAICSPGEETQQRWKRLLPAVCA